MHSSQLIQIWKSAGIWISGEADLEFDQIVSDTRNLEESSRTLFFARKGSLVDGHDFLELADSSPNVEALVIEDISRARSLKKPIFVVRDTRLSMAKAAKALYSDPSSKIFCAAVTGTNGKTTTAFLLQHLLNSLHLPTAITGTIRTEFGDQSKESSLTTPDFLEWQKFLSGAVERGAKAFSLEASSHALKQGRLLGLELDAAIFTNLSPEHLDFHESMENYFQAKKLLFSEILVQSTKKDKWAILPDDRAYGSRLFDELGVFQSLKRVRWGFHDSISPIDLRVEFFESSIEGLKMRLNWRGDVFSLESPLIGKFNLENVVGVLSLLLAKGFPIEELQRAMESFSGVPGRLERVRENKNIFVDYAHTPDALENILSSLRPLCEGKLIVVFGCGGNRDASKRPRMAEIVELYADEFVITSDNPRNENPMTIIEQMLKGLQRVKKFSVEVDRREAIRFATTQMTPKDVLVIAGKGHEKFQEIGTEKIEFDDVRVAREFSF
jgi:UDP-N-acetylmuramoyl-L-alanyl-D-glutamate--2,6-diaminopimelate ligase